MNVYLIRHGESTNNAGLSHQDDPPLTDRGRIQAQLVAKALEALDIEMFYCSPMLRALETVRPILRALRVPLEVRPELCEHGGLGDREHNGVRRPIPGPSRSEVLKLVPGATLSEEITESGWWRFVPADEEELLRFTRRQVEFLWELWQSRHQPSAQTIGAVIHGRSGSILLSAFFGLETDRGYARFGHHNTGITRVEWTPDRRRLVFLNRIEHLPPELIT
ncbi:MAG: phosphoglycerate mutase [Candidatus Poribacteria bacterium]|nr:MAG: phosphoglycerate mutase [Candidatus Poribacteria bacterium]